MSLNEDGYSLACSGSQRQGYVIQLITQQGVARIDYQARVDSLGRFCRLLDEHMTFLELLDGLDGVIDRWFGALSDGSTLERYAMASRRLWGQLLLARQIIDAGEEQLSSEEFRLDSVCYDMRERIDELAQRIQEYHRYGSSAAYTHFAEQEDPFGLSADIFTTFKNEQ